MSTTTLAVAPRPWLGIALVMLAATEFAWLDACMRWVSPRTPLPLVLLVRYSMQALLMGATVLALTRVPALARRVPGVAFATQHPRFQLLRGSLLLLSSAFIFAALRFMPLAEVTAVSMLGPVLVTLMAATVLREPVSPLQWVLVLLCFGGALVVVRPGSGLFGWAAVLPLLNAMSYAIFNLLSGRLAHLESPFTTNFYSGLVGTMWMALVWLGLGLWEGVPTTGLVAAWQALSASDLLVMVVGSVLGTVGHLVLIFAMRYAPTSTLMPFTYVQILSAALAGYLVFGNVPDGWAWVGMAIIGLSGAALVWHNQRAAALALSARE